VWKGRVVCELCHAALEPRGRDEEAVARRQEWTGEGAVPGYGFLLVLGVIFHVVGFGVMAVGMVAVLVGVVSVFEAQQQRDPFAPLGVALGIGWGVSLLASSLGSLAVGQGLLRLRDIARNTWRTAEAAEGS
jgi:hypothetical protein